MSTPRRTRSHTRCACLPHPKHNYYTFTSIIMEVPGAASRSTRILAVVARGGRGVPFLASRLLLLLLLLSGTTTTGAAAATNACEDQFATAASLRKIQATMEDPFGVLQRSWIDASTLCGGRPAGVMGSDANGGWWGVTCDAEDPPCVRKVSLPYRRSLFPRKTGLVPSKKTTKKIKTLLLTLQSLKKSIFALFLSSAVPRREVLQR